ncbi:MAG: endo-1,4-beta-xylanase, partial [Ruminococcaceae bacterium]|nr:endo-1,4-beta-xylanase [Oscillospiraceae bacterium]
STCYKSDFITGASYDAAKVLLTNEQDATTGSGKSLKMSDRSNSNHRVKLLNAFSKDEIGKDLVITAKVYIPGESGKVRMAAFSNTNTEFATSPVAETTVSVNADTWTEIKLTYKHENEIITQLGFDQTGAPRNNNIYIDDIKISTAVAKTPLKEGELRLYKEWNFDALESFSDFEAGGGYKASKASVSTDFDANGNGKSWKIADRTASNERVKITNVFSQADIGKIFTITAKIYIPDNESKIEMGVYSKVNTAYAMDPIAASVVKVEKNKWTETKLVYKHEDALLTEIGFDQIDSKTIPLFYLDDIKVYEGGSEKELASTNVKAEEVPVELENLAVTDGHRPVPTNFTRGKNYEDLIYIGAQQKTAEELLNALPEGKEIVGGNFIAELVEKGTFDKDRYNTDYGKFEVVTVDPSLNLPFTKALRAHVYGPLDPAYAFQIGLGTPLKGNAETGDVCLLRVWMRTQQGGEGEEQMGNVMVVIESGSGNKTIAANVSNAWEWKEFFFPFVFEEGKESAKIRLAYYQQIVDIGGYSITNYGKNVDIKDLPTDSNSSPYLAPEAEWRREAWDRILDIRKGDFKLIVKDESGNVIPNAKINVDMYEHEFLWGTAINRPILSDNDYRKMLQTNFNAVVPENHGKWNFYMDNQEEANKILAEAKSLGIKHIRGHNLFPQPPILTAGGTGTPEDLPGIYNDYDALYKRLKGHAELVLNDLREYISDEWDITNEASRQHEIRTDYDIKVIKTYYEIAREILGKDATLYYNEHRYSDDVFEMLQDFVDADIDFDGIGIQSHYGTPLNPVSIYETFNKFAAYGKEIKVTEYDYNTTDFDLQANFTRDFMITAFSHPSMAGFVLWGMRGGTQNQYILYDKDNNPRPALQIWQDLIYNKWWTNEEGTTNADGSFDVNAFYGDFDITVDVNGVSKKATAKLYKANEGTVEVVVK